MPPITEHSITIDVTLPTKAVTADMEVFFNPIMVSNRNISILLLNSIPNTKMNLADPLTGSGIRALRFCKELEKGKIKQLFVNDAKEKFLKTFKQNLRRNKLNTTKTMTINNDDASRFLLNYIGFDYIDIDPFGSPNPFLAAAVARISRGGIIAITATDTAALTGTYPTVTPRKYWATPLKNNYMMHELGLRILIRKIQLQGIQFDKALTPILSYHKDHYFRIYLRNEKGKERCDEIIRQHQYFLFCNSCGNFTTSTFNKENCACGIQFQWAGPLWTGSTMDQELIATMSRKNSFPEEQKFLNLLKEEASLPVVGFYDIHEIARKLKISAPPLYPTLWALKGVRTHFSPTGFKSAQNINDVLKVVKKVVKKH